MSQKHLPLLWFLTGTIGDALMALCLCHEVAELNNGLKSTLLVRNNERIIKDLAKLLPEARVEAVSFSPASLVRLTAQALRPWQVMSAWKSVGLRRRLRSLFLLNFRTRVTRFDFHAPATNRDIVAPYDMSKLVIDNFRVLAQSVGLKTKTIGSPAALPFQVMTPKNFSLAPHSYVVFHPLGSNEIKSLPLERARNILQTLAGAYPALSFVVTGGAQDAEIINQMIAGLPRTRGAVGLPILEVAGLIKNAALYIGVDTGITHLAAMMEKEMLALEHPTMPRWFPTYNPKTMMLLDHTSTETAALWGISDEAVVTALKRIA